MRALLAALAVAGVLVACSDVPTDLAAVNTDTSLGNAEYYCPNPFSPTGSKEHEEVDHNGDFQICKLDILLDDKVTIQTTYVDNNVPVQLGVCPNGFDVALVKTPKEGETTVDRNGDGFACQATRPNGTVVVIDNRFEVEKVAEPPKEGEVITK